MCPYKEFFLVRIFLYLVGIQENTGQKKLRIWTLFTQYSPASVSFSDTDFLTFCWLYEALQIRKF